jgi:hypothetical protein
MTTKDERLLKAIDLQLSEASKEADDLKMKFTEIQREHSLKCQEIENLRSKRSELGATERLKVSDHAIVRYFERVKGYNIYEIENEILSNEFLRHVSVLGGNGKYPSNGFKVVLKNYTVTTII